MTDCLLRGLKQIHEDVFRGKDGLPVISFRGFYVKYVKDMRKVGVLFHMVLGRGNKRKRYLCGWRHMIINYRTVLGQKEDEEKRKRKGKI